MPNLIMAGRRLPEPSLADRNIAWASKGHCSIHAVLGDDDGVHIQAESWLEMRHFYLLNADPNILKFREQALFNFGPDLKRRHFFDAFATTRAGTTIAYTVKPEVRLISGNFLGAMQEIAWWVKKLDFADETRLLTEADVDPVALHNAQVIAAARASDPEAEAVARHVIGDMIGSCSLRDLTNATAMQARGYRALLRLIRLGALNVVPFCRITPQALVCKPETRS